MRIIDTHAHIYVEEFVPDMDSLISRAKDAGVEKILMPNIDLKTIAPMNELANRFPGYCIPMMGLHPNYVEADWRKTLKIIKEELDSGKYIAVGEIGIDLYWDTTYKKQQIVAFEEQLRWSIEFNLPVSIHTRNATKEAIRCLYAVNADKLRGVFHCFGGTEEDLSEVLELKNFMLGISGVSTFSNSTLPKVLKGADLSRIIVETDAPYLSPVPHRGKRNEPAHTLYIINKLAEIYGVSADEVGEITTKNAKELFNI